MSGPRVEGRVRHASRGMPGPDGRPENRGSRIEDPAASEHRGRQRVALASRRVLGRASNSADLRVGTAQALVDTKGGWYSGRECG